VKNIGKPHAPAKPNMLPTGVDLERFDGHWDGEGGKYELSFPNQKHNLQATIEGDRMIVKGEAFPMVFERDY